MPESPARAARLLAIVSGRVQGVGFRYFVEANAVSLGLTGWVRNRWDGTVETVAEGNREQLESFLATLKRGPRAASVAEVSSQWQEATGEFNGFSIKMTG